MVKDTIFKKLTKPAGCRIKGFTLAEVLITLGVIGIVAAMTLPSVLGKFREKATVTKLKKFYSVLWQGYLFAVEEFGTPDIWGAVGRDASDTDEENETYNAQHAIIIRDRLLKNVKLLRTCNNAKNQKACGFADKYFYRNGNVDNVINGSKGQTASALMNDGASVMVIASSGESRGSGVLKNVYALIYIDVNGRKAPNMYGNDFFFFYLTKNGITPTGTESETKYRFGTSCQSTGLGCEAWVIENENMDYLHCSGLSWSGPTKCK